MTVHVLNAHTYGGLVTLSMEDFVGYSVRLARHHYRSCNLDQSPYILGELACVNTCRTARVQFVAVSGHSQGCIRDRSRTYTSRLVGCAS